MRTVLFIDLYFVYLCILVLHLVLMLPMQSSDPRNLRLAKLQLGSLLRGAPPQEQPNNPVLMALTQSMCQTQARLLLSSARWGSIAVWVVPTIKVPNTGHFAVALGPDLFPSPYSN